nr:uncharacterized protein LOC118971884 isoform X3 [Manis javanica]
MRGRHRPRLRPRIAASQPLGSRRRTLPFSALLRRAEGGDRPALGRCPGRTSGSSAEKRLRCGTSAVEGTERALLQGEGDSDRSAGRKVSMGNNFVSLKSTHESST